MENVSGLMNQNLWGKSIVSPFPQELCTCELRGKVHGKWSTHKWHRANKIKKKDPLDRGNSRSSKLKP
ncbi:hypothetical protein M5D96_013525, partial [Drosophila gunungcola]